MQIMIERTARVAAPAALALFVAIGLLLTDRSDAVAVASAAVGIAAGLVLAGWRLRGWALLAGCLVAGGSIAVLCSAAPGNLGWFGICVLAGWVSLGGRVAPAVVFLVAATILFLTEAVIATQSGWGAWPAGTLFTTVACLLAARQRVLLEQLQEAQAGIAERTRADERSRIAREMHDVIGHALTVTLLHIGSARLALDDEPDAARGSLLEAERHARQSLEEIRSSVGLLREEPADPGEASTRPLPGAGDLPDLVAAFRRTGAAVSCDVVGDATRLSASTGLAAYRIVQEALTNAARHAPGTPSEVRLQVEAGRAVVVVDSAGAPGRRTTGNGLIGMRERAEAVGGHLDAGPAGTGWRVEAVLPT